MIEFQHVYKTYPGPVHALKDVHFKIAKGEFVFLTGPSGAGKTTIFKMISAYDSLSSGELQIGDYKVSELTTKELPLYRRKLGIVFQDYKLLKNKTVFDNISLPLIIQKERDSYTQRRVREVLDQVGLFHKKEQFPESLSGGEQQRVAIARAIIHQPGILIADEPTGNLDPELSEEIIDLFEKISAQGTTVFIATHDQTLVKKKNKRNIHIQNGSLVQIGSFVQNGSFEAKSL
ncbi:MAG TPA: cell division ATP-binding protein FtsE [Pseudobdellovibrionaceae bacterium]|nr:cell division ATP-binding protein FtsE [Pseudobdellovibrionaceae bacterium]